MDIVSVSVMSVDLLGTRYLVHVNNSFSEADH